MKNPLKAQTALVLVAISVVTSTPAGAQSKPPEGSTWFDRDGRSRSRAELDVILREHALWLSADGRGARADLSDTDLSGVDLHGVTLNRANVARAVLGGANLTGAFLFQADLSGVDLSSANLRGARAYEADLSGARLLGTNLMDARVFDADLTRAMFEPTASPLTESMARVEHLELMTYADNSGPLTEMRTALKDRGFREAERKVTYALKRREAEILSGRCEREPILISRANACGFYLLNRVAFDLPSQYGMTPGRPLVISAALWLLFTLLYAVFMHLPGTSGLYVVVRRVWKGHEQVQGMRITPRTKHSRRRWLYALRWIRSEWRVLRAAMMFSLMSAFNISFREIDFGRWIRLLMKREYDIKAVGWVRTASGVQSLVSVYLVALWLLTYFGRPFE